MHRFNFIAAVFVILSACSSGDSTDAGAIGEDGVVDLAAGYNVERLTQAIWVLTKFNDGLTDFIVEPTGDYALLFGKSTDVPPFRSIAGCSIFESDYRARDNASLQFIESTENSEACPEESEGGADAAIRSMLNVLSEFNIADNTLTIITQDDLTLTFQPGYAKGFEKSTNAIINTNTQNIDIEEYEWRMGDIGAGGVGNLSINLVDLPIEQLNTLKNLKSTPIYVNPDCPENGTSIDGKSFFIIYGGDESSRKTYQHGLV